MKHRPILKLRFGDRKEPQAAVEAQPTAPTWTAAELIEAQMAAPAAVREQVETHVLVGVLPRAANYAISSEFHPEYAARACEDVPAATLRLWLEFCKFVAQPSEAHASEITMLMRQIINGISRSIDSRQLALALSKRRDVQLANATERERTVMERHKKSGDAE